MGRDGQKGETGMTLGCRGGDGAGHTPSNVKLTSQARAMSYECPEAYLRFGPGAARDSALLPCLSSNIDHEVLTMLLLVDFCTIEQRDRGDK